MDLIRPHQAGPGNPTLHTTLPALLQKPVSLLLAGWTASRPSHLRPPPHPRPLKQRWRRFSGINLFIHNSISGKGKLRLLPFDAAWPLPPAGVSVELCTPWGPSLNPQHVGAPRDDGQGVRRGWHHRRNTRWLLNPILSGLTPQSRAPGSPQHNLLYRTPKGSKSRKTQTQRARESSPTFLSMRASAVRTDGQPEASGQHRRPVCSS